LLVRAHATPLCSSQASEGGLPAPSEPNSVPTAGNANGIPGPRLWFEVCSITEVMEWIILRKEVIQPHLPVRLPCYDFVPITSPTFDGSLPQKGG